jgi:general stress protein 26
MNRDVQLSASEAAKKVKEMAEKIKVCLFFTGQKNPKEQEGRPMSVARADETGNIFFLADKNSEKVKIIGEDNRVHLVFCHPGKDMYLNIYGEAYISTEKERIEELWSSSAKTWFKEGKNDPSICAIRVKTDTGYYWDDSYGQMIEIIKLFQSVPAREKPIESASEKIIHNN